MTDISNNTYSQLVSIGLKDPFIVKSQERPLSPSPQAL
jgi:hypothetical protein